MRTKLAIVFVAAGMLVAVAPVGAHHAFAAEFDAAKPVKLTGAVSKVELINPHAWIHIDVKGEDGKLTTWMIEGGSPNLLLRRGFTRTTLPKGTVIIVEGYQAKDGSAKANGRDITFPDGKKMFMGSAGGDQNPTGK